MRLPTVDALWRSPHCSPTRCISPNFLEIVFINSATLANSATSISTAIASPPFGSNFLDRRFEGLDASRSKRHAHSGTRQSFGEMSTERARCSGHSCHRRSCRGVLQRTRRVPLFAQPQFLRSRVGDAFRFHVAESAYGLGKRRQLHGCFIAIRLEPFENLQINSRILQSTAARYAAPWSSRTGQSVCHASAAPGQGA